MSDYEAESSNNEQIKGKQLHRLVKLAVDTGEAATIADANNIFKGYRLAIHTGPEIAESPTLQASLLTAVNTGRRCFLGGVEVSGDLDVPLLIPWLECRSLAEAIINLKGELVEVTSQGIPHIIIGDSQFIDDAGEFSVKVTFNGWCGGVVPVGNEQVLSQKIEFTPSGVLAGALGVSEAFQFIRGDNPMAGRRPVGLSLWKPENSESWLMSEPGPQLRLLPTSLWLIGLGHLGQAYLWTLGFLPYSDPREMHLVLQDFDDLELANDSTSMLTTDDLIGQKKTRAMAQWCEQRGFRSKIIERKFASNFEVDSEDPLVALCGVDNKNARADLEGVGFKRIIEAGLGKGTQEYLSFQTHSFPASRSARELWGNAPREKNLNERYIQQPAYQALAKDGFDECGLTQLAGRSVGAAFVGAIASTIVIADLLRMAMGEKTYEVIDGDLRNSLLVQAISGNNSTIPFNPGISEVKLD